MTYNDLAARFAQAENFGMRAADAFLMWCDTDDIRHLARWAKIEREFEEWRNERYRPEMLP